MIYILFFGLCCMFVTAYLMNQKDILSPWVITIGMFLVSTFFAILNIDTWQFTLSPLTVFVILTGVFAFGVGEILISAAFEKHAVPKRKQNRGISRIEIPQTIVIVIVLGMVAGLAVMIKQTYEFRCWQEIRMVWLRCWSMQEKCILFQDIRSERQVFIYLC